MENSVNSLTVALTNFSLSLVILALFSALNSSTSTDIPDPFSPLLLIVHPAGLQGYIPYPHRAAVCRFELVDLLFFCHMTESIGEHHL